MRNPELKKEREEISRIDREMAALFEKRMEAAERIAACKKKHGLPVRDEARERELKEQNRALISDPSLRDCYDEFLQEVLALSRARQEEKNRRDGLWIRVEDTDRDYPVILCPGGLSRAKELLSLPERVLVLTDEGVPGAYARTLSKQLPGARVVQIPGGEKCKCEKTLFDILSVLSEEGFTRSDGLVALGGGVVGDLGGLAASLYLRGIPWYLIPTTLLSQVDSSIGGKTAIDFSGRKNAVGAFYPPRGVLADPGVLVTLPERQIRAGLGEMIKIAAVLDASLFEKMEACGDLLTEYVPFIAPCIALKAQIVRRDPRERGLRRVLNFGHTVGHGVESLSEGAFLHGECVAMGMACMCEKEAGERISALLSRVGLPTKPAGEKKALSDLIAGDKKRVGEKICTVVCREIGSFEFVRQTPEEICRRF